MKIRLASTLCELNLLSALTAPCVRTCSERFLNEEISTAHAAAAAAAVAAAHGLRFSGGRLIGGYSNTLIRLVPLPLLARVATRAGTVRSSNDWMAREVAVAFELASAGAQAVPPSNLLPAGPHEWGGLALTFWEYLPVMPESLSPAAAGEALRNLHVALVGCTVPLPRLGPLEEAFRLLGQPELVAKVEGGATQRALARSLKRVRDALDGRTLSCRPLHGDAHHGNLLHVSGRRMWCDFEDVCSGPLEWDFACLTASSTVLGSGRAGAEALGSYGRAFDKDLLGVMIEARTLQAVAWALVSLPDPDRSERLHKRLAWLAARPA